MEKKVKPILIELKPEDFIDTAYGNILNCPLCHAIYRQLGVEDVAIGFGELDITQKGINKDYTYDTALWNYTIYTELKDKYNQGDTTVYYVPVYPVNN